MTALTLDKTDLNILDALQRDASVSHKRLAELCHVSEATCSRRIASLAKRGYLSGHTVKLDRNKLGFKLSVFVLVTMEKEHAAELKRFEDRLRKLPMILNISFISGEFDYLLHIVTKDMQHYTDFTEEYLVRENHVKKYMSLFEMKSLKQSNILPLKAHS